jgi:hypothetical protein
MMVSIPVVAESLQDALDQSKSLRESDFVKWNGEYEDGKIEIEGITGNWDI